MRRALRAAVVVLGMSAAAGQGASPAPPAAQIQQAMADVRAQPGLLAAYLRLRQLYALAGDAQVRNTLAQQLSFYATYVGDYAEARRVFPFGAIQPEHGAPSPLARGTYRAEPAVAAIARLARGRRLILFNESHSLAQSRTLTLSALAALRKEGFDYFAAETLGEPADALAKRGYPTDATGVYTREPVYAELIRAALRLGFKVVPYEYDGPGASVADRERGQAENLYRSVFARDPHARLVVHAGYAHIYEGDSPYMFGARTMAQHLEQLTGLDALTIDQTTMLDFADSRVRYPAYNAIEKTLHAAGPVVFVDKAGRPWSLQSRLYDVSVFFPPETDADGRPGWLTLGGRRQTYRVTPALCGSRLPCLIEARYANEGLDAIPADRCVLWRGQQQLALFLAPGRYRLDALDARGTTTALGEIAVSGSPAASPSR